MLDLEGFPTRRSGSIPDQLIGLDALVSQWPLNPGSKPASIAAYRITVIRNGIPFGTIGIFTEHWILGHAYSMD
jgi:hypothetical protein